MDELLRLEQICFQYEESRPVLKNISVTMRKGERIAVLGNNGAGKSTFFLCCNGVLRPHSGEIYLRGMKIGNSKKDIMNLRQSVGLVFQDPDSQIIAGTVESEVSFGPMNLNLGNDEVALRVNRSLRQMNLDGYQTRAPHYLSGGEKKRVSIADILAMQPDIILLDEPTASLDPENVVLLEKTLDEFSQGGITLVISTHDVDFAYQFASRGIVFSNGEIIADSSIDEVFSSGKILDKAGLKKPLLYAAAEMLEAHFPDIQFDSKPRNIGELEDYIKKAQK